MNRRGFLGSILAACAAPAIVRADSLMRIVPTDTFVLGVGAYDVTIGAGPSYSANGLDMRFASANMATALDDYAARIIVPAIEALRRQVDGEILATIQYRRPLPFERRA